MSQKIINKRSSVITEDGKPKLPSSDTIDYGEIAINYADGVETLSIKNSANEIIEFKSKEYVDNLVDNNKEIYVLDATRTDYETLFNEVSEAWDSNKQIILNFNPGRIQLIDTLLTKVDKDEYSMAFAASQVTIPSFYGNSCIMIPLLFVTIFKDNIELNGTPISEFTMEDSGYISWWKGEIIDLKGNGDGTQFLSNDGTYKPINVDTSAIEQRIDGVETTIEENELVTSTALNDLNARIIDIETNKASNTHDHDDKYLTSEQVQAMIDAAIAAAMGNNSTE